MLEAQTSREHAVTAGVLEDVALATAYHIHIARNHVGPRADVMLRIGHDGRMARGTTGRVDADGIIHIAANETKGIVLTKILLGGKRNLTNILRSLNRIWRNAQITEAFLIERRLQGDSNTRFQFLYLELSELLAWHFLDFWLPAFPIGLDGRHDFLISHVLVILFRCSLFFR